jgi:hypothetical protein
MWGAQAYLAATVASVTTAVGFNRFIAANPSLSQGSIGRFVPLIAVAAANCVNIPLMRQVRLQPHRLNGRRPHNARRQDLLAVL